MVQEERKKNSKERKQKLDAIPQNLNTAIALGHKMLKNKHNNKYPEGLLKGNKPKRMGILDLN